MRISFLHKLFFVVALFSAVVANAAAPAGSWWDPAYGFRRQISIPVVGAANLVAGYSLKITFDHAAEVAAGRSLASGNDVRVVYWNGTAWTDLDRVVDPLSGWNSATTEIWFDTSAIIAGATTSTDYYLYFGNAAAGAPLANADNVFLLYDAFGDNTVDASKWNTSGTVTEAGGNVTLSSNGARLRSDLDFPTDTLYETRADMSAASGAGFNWFGASSATTFTGDFLYFQTSGSATPGATHRVNVEGTTQNIAVPSPTAMTSYSVARQGAGVAHFWVNGAINAAPTYTFNAGAPAGNLEALMRTDAAGISTSYDYVRIRRYRNVEPLPTLGNLDDNLIAAWHFGEASWNGTIGEVNDSGLYALDGRAFNGAQTAGGVVGCRYGTFNGSNQYVEVPDNNAFDRTNQLSVAVWIYPRSYGTELKSIVSKDENYEFHLTPAGQINWWWNGGGTRSITTTGTAIPLNQWTHIAITYQSGQQRVYINGVVRGTAALAEALPVNALALQIGYDGAGSAQPLRYWDGYIDAVQIYGKALTTAQVVTAMNATQPCPMNAHHLAITHDGSGIHCLAEQITVSPHDASHNAFTTYTELITLNTGASNGDWTLLTGSGTLTNGTANDGQATYQWVSGETSATFLLTYREGPASINITASSATITDDNTEGNIVWGASGFTVTAAQLDNPPILPITTFAANQVAGTPFDLHIAAYGTTPTDSQCGVIESYTGTKALKFWSAYANPATGTRNVSITGTTTVSIATSEPPSVAQNVVFSNGRASVSSVYRDVGSISISVKDDTVSAPVGGIRGATSNFVVRPYSFVIVSPIERASDGVDNPAAGGATGPVFITAGSPFRVTVRATEQGGTATPNFGQESTPESVRLQSNLVAPAGGQNPAIGSNFGAFSGGESTASTFTWSEVGIITITPRLLDGNYLGAGDVVGSATGNVGRFIPANFNATVNVPSFQTPCTAGGFGYVGQPFNYSVAPVITVTARAVGGTTTRNYTGSYFKLTNASLNPSLPSPPGRVYAAASGTLLGVPAAAGDPVIADLTNGIATLTYGSGSGFSFDRGAPIAPFAAQISLSQNVIDTDSVAAANPISFGNIAFSGGNQQRYGRIAFRNAVGSELLNLPLSMRAEYFLSSTVGFVTNTADTCTTGVTLPTAPLPSPYWVYSGNLSAGETCLLDTGSPGVSGAGCAVAGPVGQQFRMPPLAGDFIAILRAPGAGNSGSVTVTADVPTWLRFDWDASNPALDNPSGTAVFGIYQGESRRIFQTEK